MFFPQSFAYVAAVSHLRIGQRLTKATFGSEQHVVVTASGTGHAIGDEMLLRPM